MAMNLHAIAGPIVGIISGTAIGNLYTNDGYDTLPSGKRGTKYIKTTDVPMQVQALTGPELQLTESLNIQGVKRAVHLMGDVRGVDRASGVGGDILEFAGAYWLVGIVLETWDASGWCRVAAIKQNEPPQGVEP